MIVLPTDVIPLQVGVLDYGYERRIDREYFWDGMKRGRSPFSIWQYTISGKGMVSHRGRDHAVLPGMAMMLEVPQDHQYYLPKDSDHWEFIWVNLKGAEAMRIWRELTKRTGPVAILPDGSNAAITAGRILHVEQKENMKDPYNNSAIGYLFLMQLVQELMPTLEEGRTPKFIQEVAKYCLENIGESITVDDMARVAGYSKYHFNRVFKEFQGITPMAYLRQLRMNHAFGLLQTTRLNIKEIADQCGFEDASYFCKVFRSQYKISPGRFRNQGDYDGGS